MSTTLAAGLARKLKKVLDTRTDSPELLSSLNALSSIYTTNNPHARRSLRTTIERRGLSINEEFLAASESAQKALDAVELEVRELAECCDRISTALNSCASNTGDMVIATERLKQELEGTTHRQELIANFLHNYQLTNDEMNALRQEDLDERFFDALARVHQIHANCKILLRTHHQRAGLELMDIMSVYQEGAYERLCRWVQKECKNLGDSDTPEISELLRTAARSLKERPVLFNYCAEEVANSRHNALFRRFIAALTRGGPGGLPRPIEVHAHDPLRYVGDMLAWLHQALASEKELASALFSTPESEKNGSVSKRFITSETNESNTKGEGEGEEEASATDMLSKPNSEVGITSVLDRIFEGVCRPFKARVEQVLSTQPALVIVSKLGDLLAFYSQTVWDLLGEQASLTVTIKELHEEARKTLLDLIKSRGDKLLRYPSPIASDLSPPPALSDAMALLLELIDSHNRMMIPEGRTKPDFEPILSAMIDPLIEMCERAAAAYGSKSTTPRGQLPKADSMTLPPTITVGKKNSKGKNSLQAVESMRIIFLVNCFSAIIQPLENQQVVQKRVNLLSQTLEDYLSKLTQDQLNSLLQKCNLNEKLTRMKQLTESQNPPRLSDVPGLTFQEISEPIWKFVNLLVGNEGEISEFEFLQIPKLRAQASNRVARNLCEVYELIFECVLNPFNGYDEAKSLVRHTPDQMRTILGL